ncbi:uncharacterized protein LOC125139268 [Tachysurus fulvidraco]|uniref:uncharacterized protein LOC125139268 n=1 Tax=Tachysurus fulvidraco TaxID=1234273 RepID=UPI001FEDAC3A|nr:uncharacterized protein LOC125139268 [Tachysurus fulvidraco]
MSNFWILLFVFSTMYTVHPGRHCVTAQSPTKPQVYQPDKELSVNIGDSATLQCCVSENVYIITWYKQPNREKPQIVVTVYKSGGETFHTGFQKSRFQIERSLNCFNMIILNITQSDEAMYYCAVRTSITVFGDGTYLQIKGDHVTIASETSKAALCDHSVVCEPTLHGNNTNTNTQHNTVIGLGSALGLCALLIFLLTYYILRRRKPKTSRSNTSVEDSPGAMLITNHSTDDTSDTTLHLVLIHLDNKNTYVRMLFIDFSSEFNTIIPQHLTEKLSLLGLNTSISTWVLDFLTGRHQLIRIRNSISITTLNTGDPQGCVLSSLLFTLLTHDPHHQAHR